MIRNETTVIINNVRQSSVPREDILVDVYNNPNIRNCENQKGDKNERCIRMGIQSKHAIKEKQTQTRPEPMPATN